MHRRLGLYQMIQLLIGIWIASCASLSWADAGALHCMARDDNGQAFWDIAVISPSRLMATVPGTRFLTNAECQLVVERSRMMERGVLACLSRDASSQSPWVPARISYSSASVTVLPGMHYDSLDECTVDVSSARSFQGHVVLCASKEQEGEAPWILARLNNEGYTHSETSIVFHSLAQCRSALASARPLTQGLAICGSLDQDGRSPWTLYRMTRGGSTRLNIVYDTLQDCLADGGL